MEAFFLVSVHTSIHTSIHTTFTPTLTHPIHSHLHSLHTFIHASVYTSVHTSINASHGSIHTHNNNSYQYCIRLVSDLYQTRIRMCVFGYVFDMYSTCIRHVFGIRSDTSGYGAIRYEYVGCDLYPTTRKTDTGIQSNTIE